MQTCARYIQTPFGVISVHQLRSWFSLLDWIYRIFKLLGKIVVASPLINWVIWNRVIKINHRLWRVQESREILPEIEGADPIDANAVASILGFGFLLGYVANIVDGKIRYPWIGPVKTWRFGKIKIKSVIPAVE